MDGKKKGLVNPSCTGLIGSGLVVHLPSLFNEIDALESQGTDDVANDKMLMLMHSQVLTVRVVCSSLIVPISYLTFIKSLMV